VKAAGSGDVTVRLMMWPSALKTGCRTFRHTAEITAPAALNSARTTRV
jgi:hypothetical protein